PSWMRSTSLSGPATRRRPGARTRSAVPAAGLAMGTGRAVPASSLTTSERRSLAVLPGVSSDGAAPPLGHAGGSVAGAVHRPRHVEGRCSSLAAAEAQGAGDARDRLAHHRL